MSLYIYTHTQREVLAHHQRHSDHRHQKGASQIWIFRLLAVLPNMNTTSNIWDEKKIKTWLVVISIKSNQTIIITISIIPEVILLSSSIAVLASFRETAKHFVHYTPLPADKWKLFSKEVPTNWETIESFYIFRWFVLISFKSIALMEIN